MNQFKKTTKGFSLTEVLISIVIMAIMAGAFLLNNNSQKKSQEVQLATRTLAAQLRLMQNDALNGKVIGGDNICGIKMTFNNESQYDIRYYSQCSGFDLGSEKNMEAFNLQKSKLGVEPGSSIIFLAPFGLVKPSLGGENISGILLESKDSNEQMVVCVGQAGNIEEIKGKDTHCFAVGMCDQESPTQFCTRLGAKCGSVTGVDNCGIERKDVNCEPCNPPEICSNNACVCPLEDDAAFCARLVTPLGKKRCGEVEDNNLCGTKIKVDCGTCASPDVCYNTACCTPNCAGKECGDDGCGGICPPGCTDPLQCSPINFVCTNLIDDCKKLQDMKGDGKYELTGYIECSDTKNWNSGRGFEPILSFGGKLNGNDKTIGNLYMKSETFNVSQRGLFGSTQASAEIKNLKLESVINLNNHANLAGALVGKNEGTISKVSASGSISSDLQNSGGLVGENHGTISDSDASVSISGSQTIGGLVGTNIGTISNSSASGEVLATLQWAGGLVGSNVGTISNSHATGKVTGWVTAGGLVGQNINNGTISNSEASGSVITQKNGGGLVGENTNNCTINSSKASGSVSANQFSGGLVGKNAGGINDSSSKGKVEGLTNIGGFVGEDVSGATMSNCLWSLSGSGLSNGCGLGICSGVTSQP